MKDSTTCFEELLILQNEDRDISFSRNSSLENKRIRSAIGVNNPKNMTPSIIGLKIEPRIKPKRIHNLFSGNKRPGLVIVRVKKIVANNRKTIAMLKALTK